MTTEPGQEADCKAELPHGENVPSLSGLCPPETANPKVESPATLVYQLVLLSLVLSHVLFP